MERVKTAWSFQQEMLRSAARAARGGACLRSGAWIDFAAGFILSRTLQISYGQRTVGGESAQRGLGLPAKRNLMARKTVATPDLSRCRCSRGRRRGGYSRNLND
jgi:hypothetical protein